MTCKVKIRRSVSPHSVSAAVRAWRRLSRGWHSMTYHIRKAAVLGAGVMGAAIAAHLANAGIPCLLLDIVPPDAAASQDRAARNKFAIAGLEGLKKSKPAAFTNADFAKLVTVGNF